MSETLKNQDKLVGLEDALETFSEQEKTGYRLGHKDYEPEDFKSRGEKDAEDPRRRVKIELTQEQKKSLPFEKKVKAVGRWGISNFETPQGCFDVLKDLEQRVEAELGSEAARLEIEKKGAYVIQVHYSPCDGLIGPSNDKGHFEFLPYEGFEPQKSICEEFIPLYYFDHKERNEHKDE